jgi:long-chain acyl-CoA synthetase
MELNTGSTDSSSKRQAVESETPTLPMLWTKLAERFADRVALRDSHSKPSVELTYREVYDRAQQVASGLQSLGIQPGDRVALIAENSPRWAIADLGSLMAGAVNVPRSAIADSQELAYILHHSGCRVLFADNLKTWQRLQTALENPHELTAILLSDEVADECISFSSLLERGASHSFTLPNLNRTDLATLVYTSGTTGRPKAVCLTHGNLMHQVEALAKVVELHPGDRVLSILPTWHAYERACEYFALSKGCTLTYTNPRHLKADLKTEQPHFLVAVPRIWELLYDGIEQQLHQQKGSRRRLAEFLLERGERYVLQRRIATGRSILHLQASPWQRLQARAQMLALAPFYQLGDRLVYRPIRAAIAPQLRYAISGGGSLPPYIDTFYELLGIEILNGYGLTETAPVLAARRPEDNVRGTVGPPLHQTEIQIVDAETRQPLPQGQVGLVLARGPQVMVGYYNNPEATAKVLSAEGWFNTEDLGWLTPAGHLVLTGRAKDTIVLRNGENIEPVALEEACGRSPYIGQIVVVGQDQKRLGALIYPNLEAIAAWARSLDIPEDNLLHHAKVRDLLAEELKQRVQQRPGYRSDDTIADFRLVPEPFTPENGLMTQTLKIKRNQVTENYAHLVADMYNS